MGVPSQSKQKERCRGFNGATASICSYETCFLGRDCCCNNNRATEAVSKKQQRVRATAKACNYAAASICSCKMCCCERCPSVTRPSDGLMSWTSTAMPAWLRRSRLFEGTLDCEGAPRVAVGEEALAMGREVGGDVGYAVV
ncbi:hypothetical protein BHM03_00038691 [Ensete ventricosum]|nr:hypothetical protein BHM03_00038691 [Ensete ventricosum]